MSQPSDSEVKLLRDAVRRCQEHCTVEPHNDWDDGTEVVSVGGTSTITYVCQVCGRRKTFPL